MKIINKNFVQEGLLDLVSYRRCRPTYRSIVVRDGNGSVSVMYR